MTAPLLEVDELTVTYRAPRTGRSRSRAIRAVDGVSFELRSGESLGIVGESGSGKSTLARALVGLAPRSAGRIRFDGRDLEREPVREIGRDIQMIFQDPFASVNQRHTVRRIIAEPIRNHDRSLSGEEVDARVQRHLAAVQLPSAFADRLPRALSGGQLQRVGIARAIALGPRLLVADEPVSALDVSVQAQILNLIADLRDRAALTCIFIGHNVAVVEHSTDRIAVMFGGRLVEIGPSEQVVGSPVHPYSRALVAAVPRPERGRRSRTSAPTVDTAAPSTSGCPYATRCPHATNLCGAVVPLLHEHRPGHWASCHHADLVADAAPVLSTTAAAPAERPIPPESREDPQS